MSQCAFSPDCLHYTSWRPSKMSTRAHDLCVNAPDRCINQIGILVRIKATPDRAFLITTRPRCAFNAIQWGGYNDDYQLYGYHLGMVIMDASSEDSMLTQQVVSTNKLWSNIQYDVDRGIGTRAHNGMLVFDNDQTLSHEARAMLTIPGVALYESRIASDERGQSLSVNLLKSSFDGALQQINTRRSSDVVALGCTSAEMVIGQQALERRVRNVHPGAHCD